MEALMIVTELIRDVSSYRDQHELTQWGLVPTMGYLHEGHLSLIRQARKENDKLAVSIFVNPTQFAPEEDLESYPRDMDRDIQLLEEEKVDLVFTPTVETMYPYSYQTYVTVKEVSRALEGKTRPAHFQGVTTIVSKLFNIVRPSKAYFGQKDAQQCVVIKRMVKDLNIDVEIVVCPIVRESDGLAMSTRNVRLPREDRAAAPIIYRSLVETTKNFAEGERNADALKRGMLDILSTEPRARADYVSIADAMSLKELTTVERGALLSTAVYFGSIRLIDNMYFQ
jgi:pantoate--beta-alanine ligase